MRKFIETTTFRGLAMLLAAAIFCVGFSVTDARAGLIGTGQTQISQERAQDMTTVRQAIENKVVTERLNELGFSQQEIDQRLAMLSDAEVSQLSADIQNVDTAGSALGIIAGVVIVVIIVLAILEITGDAENF